MIGARARRVERVRAVATSAVREAVNGAAFVRRLRRETGLPVKIISGPEEARLIFRAAHHALGLDGGPHLLLDVGGGSVELVLVHDGRPLWMKSNIVWSRWVSHSRAMASRNAPTPGKTTLFAAAIVSAFEVISAANPTRSNAFCTLRRFAIP